MNIAILGLGAFGKAIASLLEENGLEYDYAETSERRLLSRAVDLLFITVPTQCIRPAIQDNRHFISDETIIVNCAKGIEEGSHLMVHQIVRSISRFPNYYALIGPSFAQEIVERQPTVVSLGYKNEAHIALIQKVLETSCFKVVPTRGYRSLELSSALKNLYAITCGYAYGLGFGMNTRVRLITMALTEFRTLAKAMHFADYDVMAPGVVGDMMLTCGSEQSRNFQYGMGLAKGKADLSGHTVEGYYTSHSINQIAFDHQATLPLAELTSKIIAGEVDSQEAFRKFLQ